MHIHPFTFQQETHSSLKTALHFALVGEELMHRRAVSQPHTDEELCEAWRNQFEACKRIQTTIHMVAPSFIPNPAFHYSDTRVVCLKTFMERQEEGLLVTK
jgi:hypothetical protein